MVISPLSHFSSNFVVNCPAGKGPPSDPSKCTLGVNAVMNPKCKQCYLFPTQSLMLARPALQRCLRAFSSAVRQAHNTSRNRGPGVSVLSYWNDNQAGYSWWTAGNDQEIWGKPEDIYLKLKEGYDKHSIPVKSWEPDNNFVVDYKPDLFVWLGDNIYVDTYDKPERFEQLYGQLGANPRYQKLKAACPQLAVWDDHDYGLNDGDR